MNVSTLFVAAAALALSGIPSAHAQDAIPYEQFTLSNGLRVVVHEDHSTPKVALAVWYHVGSMNEPDGKTGFAHLYEHLMFNGSEHHDAEYMPPLQEIGVSGVNGATSLDQTYYYEVVPTGGLERALWLESDRMGYLLGAVTQAKLDEQRKVVQNEKRTRENMPYALMDQYEAAALFPVGHPYHHPVIGSMADLDAASLDDVKDWFRAYYGAANAVVVLSGDVTPEHGKALVQKYFGSVSAGPPVSRPTAWVPVLTRDRAEMMTDNVPETAIDWSWAVPGRGTTESQALQMAARILGFGKTSRLYRALVHDKQIATTVSASYAAHAIAGIFSVDVRLKPGVDRATAAAAVKDVMQQFLADGPAADELERAKASAFADSARALESIYVRAMALADGTVFAGDPGRYAKNDALFQALDAGEVRTTANAWLSKPSYELTVLPYGTYQVAADGADRASMPPLGPSPKLTLPVLQHATLSNGIRVSLAPREGAPIVELTMVFDAGEAADQHMKSGLGDFTLGLMDEGTQTLTAQEFAYQEARLGARIYASSDVDTTTIALSALNRSLDESVALWADYIRNPGFRAPDLERDRALRLSALSQSLADPTAIAQRTFTNLIYGADHAYGAPLAHRAETLRSITLDDVATFHDRWIRPDNAVIYAAGDTDLETLVPALEQAFGAWSTPAAAKGEKTLDPIAGQAAPRIVLIDKPGAIQSVIRVGQTMPSTTDPRTFDIEAMNAVLGGNFTSRLNMNLREGKGWTYGANSYVAEALGPSVFGVATSVQTDKTAEALGEINKEIAAIRETKPVTPDELNLMEKGEVLALPGRFETNRAMVSYLQYVARFDRPYDWITTLPEQYRGLDPAAITEAAQMLHPDALTWVVVGDLAKIEDKVRQLELGAVEVWNSEGRRLR